MARGGYVSGSTRSVAVYVRAHREGWERLGALAERAQRSRLPLAEVEALDRLYRRAAADLALVRGRFPGTEVEGYLSQLVASAYRALYRPRARAAAVAGLLREQIPAAARRHPRALLWAVLVLLAGLGGGVLAVAIEPGAAEVLVPPPVREAVAAGRTWTGHLLSAAPGVAGAALLHNNVTAAALALGMGLSAGIGTALLLLMNGLLVGAVFAYAAQHGMFADLLGFVAAHGPLEISALLLAAQAGFVLARALIEPGEWPRRAALQAAGREVAPLVAVVIPALAVAALLEAAVSPARTVPVAARAALGLALAGALWGWLFSGGRARQRTS